MKKITAKTLLILSFVILTVYSVSYAQNNFLWQVHSKGSTIYILGSVHLLKKDIYPLNRTIEAAFDKADFLAVEADINDVSSLDIQKLLKSAVYMDGSTLDKHVSQKTLDIIKEESDRLGMPIEMFYNQKPWFLGLTLTSLELVKSGYNPEYGIDKYFLNKATGRKKVLELESLDYQIDLLSGFNDDEQELFLLYVMKNVRTLVQEVNNVVDIWKSGATKRMEAIMEKNTIEDRRFTSLYEKLIINRNRSMALKIEDYLKTKGTYFVVVGAAHLLGPSGIVQLLRDKGYVIEQL